MRNLLFYIIFFLSLTVFSQDDEYSRSIEKNQTLFIQSQKFFEIGDYRKSLEGLLEIENFFEKTAEAQDIYYMIAISYQKLKDIENSYRYLKKYQNFFRYGKYNREINELVRYIEDIRERFSSIETSVPDIEALRKKVRELENERMYDLAIYNLKKIIRIEPENPMNHHELAVLYNKKEKVTSYNINISYLKRELEEYLRITQSIISPEVYYNIANLYRRLDENETAREYFEKVYEMSPESTIGKVAYSYLKME